jgi:hypothetical protein
MTSIGTSSVSGKKGSSSMSLVVPSTRLFDSEYDMVAEMSEGREDERGRRNRQLNESERRRRSKRTEFKLLRDDVEHLGI